MTSITWLHLTDFHQGINDQNWLWPNFREQFLLDLKAICEQCGSLDLLLFTGDLTQRGSADEFNRIDKFLDELMDTFAAVNLSPKFLAVPGNHDLVRPDSKDSRVKLLKQWSDNPDPEIQQSFWNNPESEYRQIVTEAFQNYVVWWEKQEHRLGTLSPGLLPGDFSATIEKNEAKLGILGLNTSFLQLTEGNYQGKLAIHPRQFQAACNNDGPAWASEHHACLLLTHHPPSWLDKESKNYLQTEITSYGRFAAHLCGHMHEAVYQELAEGGSEARRLWQGRSLFGLKHYNSQTQHYNSQTQRLHGYTVGRIEFKDRRTGALVFFPREGREQQGRQRKIVPDYSLDITNYFPHTKAVNFHLLQDYEGSPYMGRNFDIKECRDLARAISQQHKRLKQWKELHEKVQILCNSIRNQFMTEVSGWLARKTEEQRYSFIYEKVVKNKSGWRYYKTEIEESINIFKKNISQRREQIKLEECGDFQEWIKIKSNECEENSGALESVYQRIDQLISYEWADPEIDSQYLDDDKVKSFLEKLERLALGIDNYLTVVDSVLKDEVKFFETHIQSLGNTLNIDLI